MVFCLCFHHRFNPAELAFLTEYAAAMSPVAQATNILQAEANAMMGWLLPTINLLTIKLDRIKLPLKYCKPLVDALQVTFILVFILYYLSSLMINFNYIQMLYYIFKTCYFVSVLVAEMCYTNKLALQVGIKNRFGHMSGDPELIAAAILLPKFRTKMVRHHGDSEKISVYFESLCTTNLSKS